MKINLWQCAQGSWKICLTDVDGPAEFRDQLKATFKKYGRAPAEMALLHDGVDFAPMPPKAAIFYVSDIMRDIEGETVGLEELVLAAR